MRLPVHYLPHGAGPCFFMAWNPPDAWTAMGTWLGGLSGELPVLPKAIVVISAHWEEAAFSVTAAPQPELIYDYYGFPPHTYELTYPAPGAPALAARVVELLGAAGLPAREDATRGYDHGVFIPFKLIRPAADLPIVQLSLLQGLDAAQHLAAGRALAGLREEGIWLVGSGMSYHNLRGFGAAHRGVSEDFDAWLTAAVQEPAGREQKLVHWEAAPAAREAHPRAEHLLPLMVVAGAAEGEVGQRAFSDVVMGVRVSGYRLG